MSDRPLATRDGRGPAQAEASAGRVGAVGHALTRVERALGAERFTLMRVRPGDWEARAYHGEVGRGTSASDALFNLLSDLGQSIG